MVKEATDSLGVCAELAQTIAQKLTQVRQKADDELAKRNADIDEAQSDLEAAGTRLTEELGTLNGAMALVVIAVVAPLSWVLLMPHFGPMFLVVSLGAPVAFAIANSMWNWRGKEAWIKNHNWRYDWWWGIVLGLLIFFPALVWLFRYPGNHSQVKARYEAARSEAQARLDRLTGKVE